MTTPPRPDATELHPTTWAVTAGRPEGAGAPLNVPMSPTSTFVHGTERVYARNEGTEGWEAFEALMGGWDGGDAVAFASGMAACDAVFRQLPDGAHVVLADDVYQGVAGLAEAGARSHGWQVERLPVTDPRWVERGEADLRWVESPSNPLLEVADVAAICAAPRRDGALVAVDNTFATPLVQRPLELGADVAVYSATKLIGGHSDLLLGAAVTRQLDLLDRLRRTRALAGATPGTLECFLALRGARTLPLRLQHATRNASLIAAALDARPAVTSTRYPGFGTIVTFEVADGPTADALCTATQVIRHATSLGGVETTMERRATHAGQEHLPPGLIRLSVGCEHPDDLIRDLDAALGAATEAT